MTSASETAKIGAGAPRPARHEDIDALTAIEASFSSDRMSRRSFRRLLSAPTAHILVIEIEGGVAGYAVVLFRRGSAVARLYSLAVRREARGRGFGAALLAAAEAAGRERGMAAMRLEVRPDNKEAIALYRAQGYRQFALRTDYYADHADALRFEKSLALSS